MFFDKAGKQWYVLLSGRWFRAPKLDGPWTFATPDLPADFRNSPKMLLTTPFGRPYPAHRKAPRHGSRPASPPLRGSKRDRSRRPSPMRRAAICTGRDDRSLLRDEHDRHRDPRRRIATSCSRTASGSWPNRREAHGSSPARSRRDLRHTAVVAGLQRHLCARVRDEPDAVWYGYTIGYLSGFLVLGYLRLRHRLVLSAVLVQLARICHPIYYPRPVTWGMGAYYNPVRGTYGRYGYAYGPYRGIAVGRAWNPRTGTYGRAGAAWGPRGSAGFVGAYNPGPTAAAILPAAATSTAPGNRPASSAGRVGPGDGPSQGSRGLGGALEQSNGRASFARGGAATSMRAGTAKSTAIPGTAGRIRRRVAGRSHGRNQRIFSNAARGARASRRGP